MADIQFIDGLGIFKPNDNAPDFVIANGTIKVEELKAWLAKQTEPTVRIDVKVSKAGKYYCSVNDFKPSGQQAPQELPPLPSAPPEDYSDDLPF